MSSARRAPVTLILDGQRVAYWIALRLHWARRRGWSGRVVSGHRSHAEQTQLYDEWKRGDRAGPVARPGTSNHEGTRWPAGAVDVSEPLELARVLEGYRGKGKRLRHYGVGDLPHFSANGR